MKPRWVPMLAVLVVLLCGCSAARSPDATMAEVPGARAELPHGWTFMATDPLQWAGRPTLALLSNRPLAPVCHGDGPARSCSAPASELEPGQLLVWWLSTSCAGPTCSLPEGDGRLVGGREAVEVTDVSACDNLRADRQRAVFVAVSPQRTDALIVCQREADTAVEAQLELLLDGIDWRTP